MRLLFATRVITAPSQHPERSIFHDFFMGMVQVDKKEEAEKTLAAAFKKQDEGTFDASYMQAIVPQYFSLVKPECVEQLKQAMAHFSSTL